MVPMKKNQNNQIYPLQINTVIENKLGNLNLTKYSIFPEFFFYTS